MTQDAVLQELNTNAACGLTVKAARSRCKKDRSNTLFSHMSKPEPTFVKLFLREPFVWLFLTVCFLNICFLQFADALISLALFSLCVFLFVLVDFRKRRVSGVVSRSREPLVTVVREENAVAVSAGALVYGDLILLQKGDLVPCDCRLLDADRLQVLTLLWSEDQKPVYQKFPKNATIVYPADSDVEAPYCENMIYGGSVIEKGIALAVVTETGESCFVSLHGKTDFSAELGMQSDCERVASIKRATFWYHLIACVLFIPLTLVAILVCPEGVNALSVLLATSAALLLSSQTLFVLRLETLRSGGLFEAFFGKKNAPCVLFKSRRALERLAEVTDLFLLGNATVTDQKERVLLIANADGVIDPSTSTPGAYDAICEAFLWRRYADNGSFDLDNGKDLVCCDLLTLSGFDRDALAVRMLQCRRVFSSDLLSSYVVKTKSEEFTLHFYKNASCLMRCITYELGSALYSMTDDLRNRLLSLSKQLPLYCERTEFVIKQRGGNTSFVGFVSIGAVAQEGFLKTLSGMRKLGLPPKLFLFGDSEKQHAFADSIGLLAVCQRQKHGALTPCLLSLYDTFVGYSRREVQALLLQLRGEGRKILAIGQDYDSLPLLRSAYLSASYDAVLVRDKKKRRAGELSINRLSNAVRGNTDLLMPDITEGEGGLLSLPCAVKRARNTVLQMRTAFAFLLSSNLFVLLFFIYSTCTELGALSAPMLLTVDLIFSNVLLILLSRMQASDEFLQKPITLAPKRELERMTQRRCMIIASIVFGVAVILALILSLTHVLTRFGHAIFLLCALLLIVTSLFVNVTLRSGLLNPHKLFKK